MRKRDIRKEKKGKGNGKSVQDGCRARKAHITVGVLSRDTWGR